jgi:hypothetical protein
VNNITDYQNKVITNKTNKKNYIEKNGVSAPVTGSSKKLAVKYAIVGVLFGLVISAVILALKLILDNRIWHNENLLPYNLNILGSYHKNEKEQNELEYSKTGIRALSGQMGIHSIYLDSVTDDEKVKTAALQYAQMLQNDTLEITCGTNVCERADELQRMISCDRVIFVIERGKTTCEQLENHLMLCKKFAIENMGCMIVE